MPTYEYECKKCGDRFELFQSMRDPARKRCSKCRGSLQRLISGGAGVIFKGSGFYSTDYRSPDYHTAAKKDKEASSQKPAASGATAKEKPAATSSVAD